MTPVRTRFFILVSFVGWTTIVSGCVSASVQRPLVIAFGASQFEVERDLSEVCTEVRVRTIEPAQLPGAKRQSQTDCFGFDYFGAPRLAEFVFADDEPILTWKLVEESDLSKLKAAFLKQLGAPAFRSETITGFHDARAAVRKDIPETLHYAPSVAKFMETRMAR